MEPKPFSLCLGDHGHKETISDTRKKEVANSQIQMQPRVKELWLLHHYYLFIYLFIINGQYLTLMIVSLESR